ncbi:MAG: VWA domain-containing protein [Acidobacteriaceae bacterium]
MAASSRQRPVARYTPLVAGRWSLAPLLALLLAAMPMAAQEAQVPTFRSDVRLVNVFTGVDSEQTGKPVADLSKNNFEVLEDGVPQKIAIFERETVLPLSIVLAIDTSMSTRTNLKLELLSAKKFADETVRPGTDKLALYTISTGVDEVLPFTGDLKAIDRKIAEIKNGEATALFDALYLGGEALKKQPGRRVLVLITDGGDTASQTSYQDALRSALEAEAIVYSIIVVPIESNAGRNTGGEHALIQASEDTGGRYFYAKNIAQIEKAFAQIAAELRTQYRLGYYPQKKYADSDSRHIEVKLVGVAGRLTAHFRTVYFTH